MWRSVRGEHEQLQKFPAKLNESGVAAHSALGTGTPPAPHSGQTETKSFLRLISVATKHSSRMGLE